MKLLFIKEHQNWPRSSGHDVHCYYMMQSLLRQGASVSLLTADRCSDKAIDGLNLENTFVFEELPRPKVMARLNRLESKFCSYWGIDRNRISQIGELAERDNYDAVVVVGLHVLPYLASVNTAQRVWYAADEWLLHHWSQFRITRPKTWNEIQLGAIKGLYEWAFSNRLDRLWVVSDRDANAVRWVMRGPAVDVIPNGVDSDFYSPSKRVEAVNDPILQKGSLVFWGRLDFGPNIDAIEWFANEVLPKLRQRIPGSKMTIYGFQAGQKVRDLAHQFQINLIEDLPDLRNEIQKHSIVVLPFISGAGIKNKFLEAAAMARPIIASKVALNGVNLHNCTPCRIARSPMEWVEAIVDLSDKPDVCNSLGQQARQWVVENYSWERAANLAIESLATT